MYDDDDDMYDDDGDMYDDDDMYDDASCGQRNYADKTKE